MAKKENPYLVKFSKPYTFEGKEYTEIDLSGMEGIKTSQLKEAHQEYLIAVGGMLNPRPESDITYCCTIAALVCGLPQEFFDELPGKDGNRVRNMVQGFFLGGDGED